MVAILTWLSTVNQIRSSWLLAAEAMVTEYLILLGQCQMLLGIDMEWVLGWSFSLELIDQWRLTHLDWKTCNHKVMNHLRTSGLLGQSQYGVLVRNNTRYRICWAYGWYCNESDDFAVFSEGSQSWLEAGRHGIDVMFRQSERLGSNCFRKIVPRYAKILLLTGCLWSTCLMKPHRIKTVHSYIFYLLNFQHCRSAVKSVSTYCTMTSINYILAV